MNNNKINIYNSLNQINYSIYKKSIPFDLHNIINLTYNDIELRYIKDKNYFIKIDKKKQISFNEHRQQSPKRHNEHRQQSPKRHNEHRQHSPKRHNEHRQHNGGMSHNMIYFYY